MQIPPEWTFKSTEVARSFDKHVREQLPWYDLVTLAVAHLVRCYVRRGGLVYDIGASTGNIGNAIREVITQRGLEFIAIENSPEMAAQYQGPATLVIAEAESVDYRPFSVAVLFLVLQFLSRPDRTRLLQRLVERVEPGGIIVVVDRFEATAGYFGTSLSRLILAAKIAAGVPSEEVIQKELSLSGVQRPLAQDELGSSWQQFFRFADFEGWVFIK